MELQPHQKRVLAERDDLDDKIEKLDAFCLTAVFRSLSEAERFRLRAQLLFMRGYRAVLEERICAFLG